MGAGRNGGRHGENRAVGGMNDMADHVAEYKASPDFIEYRQTRIAETLGAVVMRCDALDHRVTVAMLAAMAEELGSGTPDVLLMHEKARDDARWWADYATPVEVEAYTAAGLQAISRGGFCIAARKRLLIMLWNSMSPDDKRGFLAHAAKPGQPS